MKNILTKILTVFTLLLTFMSFGQNTMTELSEKTITTKDLEIIVGEWTGSLTYIDYSSNKPYTMPANLIVKKGKNENQLLLFNIFPNEPNANSTDKIIISKNGRQLNKNNLRSKQILSNGQIEITTEYVGKDNKKKALIRNIYILGEEQFIMRKEVQFENTNEWIKRNEFSYNR
ncbi:MAG: hypothetical protein WBN17_10245 [Aureibaculum sp.]